MGRAVEVGDEGAVVVVEAGVGEGYFVEFGPDFGADGRFVGGW